MGTQIIGESCKTYSQTKGRIVAELRRLKKENLTRSESGLADTDLAEEVSNLQQGLLRFETSIRALSSQLQNEQARSRLLDFTI